MFVTHRAGPLCRDPDGTTVAEAGRDYFLAVERFPLFTFLLKRRHPPFPSHRQPFGL